MQNEGLKMDIIDKIKEMVIKGHINKDSNYPPEHAGKNGVEELVADAVQQKVPVNEILKQGLVAGMAVVGEKFSAGEYFVPEMMFSAKAMKSGLAKIRPLLVDEYAHSIGTVILGTVQGDMHDIGKNLVGMMLEGAGFTVLDLGTNITTESFVSAAKQHPDALIGMSALLTVTMQKMRDVVTQIHSQQLDNKIIIGGAPVSKQFAEEIGADGYAPDASTAVKEAKSILNIP
jgi:5-methyltetrahydrofolate--homocysteine methyltransferase